MAKKDEKIKVKLFIVENEDLRVIDPIFKGIDNEDITFLYLASNINVAEKMKRKIWKMKWKKEKTI